MPLEQEGGGAGDVRRGHARPVEDGEGAAEVLERGREDLGARCADVRLQLVPEGRQPAGREARDDAAAAGVRAPADPGRSGSRCVRRDSPDRSAGRSRRSRRSFRSGRRAGPARRWPRPGRLSTRTMPIAPAARTRAAFSAKVQFPRETSAIAPFSEPAGSGDVPPSRFPGGPQRSRGTGALFVPMIVPTSTSCWSAFAQAGGVAPVRTNGTWVSGSAAPGAVTRERRTVDVGVGERGNRDRVRRGPGRARRAEAVVVAVVACRDHGDDAGGSDVPDRFDDRVARRIDLRAAAREVDHVHPVAHRCFERGDDLGRVAHVTDGRGDVEDPVVADLRTRRDTGQSRRLRVVRAGGCGRARVAGCDSRDVRAVEGGLRVERETGLVVRAGADEGARHDHLRRRPLLAALREARRVAVALPGRRIVFAGSTPSSTTAIFTPSPPVPPPMPPAPRRRSGRDCGRARGCSGSSGRACARTRAWPPARARSQAARRPCR